MIVYRRQLSIGSRVLVGAVVALGLSLPAFAQNPPAQPQRPAARPPAAQPARPAPAPAAQAAAVATDGPAAEWLKVCGKDEKNNADVCSVTNYIIAEAGNVVGEVRVLEAKQGKETKRVLEALVPPGFLLQPGVNLVIDDQKQPIPGRYRVCFPNACLSEIPLTDDTLSKLRKGNVATFFAANPQGQWVGAKVTLAGFTKVFDGASLDPKVYEEKRKQFEEGQNKLQTELLKRADEQRQKMQQESGAAPAATPAP